MIFLNYHALPLFFQKYERACKLRRVVFNSPNNQMLRFYVEFWFLVQNDEHSRFILAFICISVNSTCYYSLISHMRHYKIPPGARKWWELNFPRHHYVLVTKESKIRSCISLDILRIQNWHNFVIISCSNFCSESRQFSLFPNWEVAGKCAQSSHATAHSIEDRSRRECEIERVMTCPSHSYSDYSLTPITLCYQVVAGEKSCETRRVFRKSQPIPLRLFYLQSVTLAA